ncbi:MAG: ATP-dependent protease subunit HslV [Candidatus Coatesbacteria bacterium]|nr:MAG: ATP-dependent protease subunit HslV [Candidatus Coatesbacteria bacterium]
MTHFHGTTVLSVRRGAQVALGADGQVTYGDTVLKGRAVKVREMLDGKVLCGFAGATADALALFERLEEKLKAHPRNLPRAAVELAKTWRTDKMLRQLDALIAAVDAEHSYVITGTGDVLEPDDGIIALGSGGPCALAAARVLLKHTELAAAEICRESLIVAASVDLYSNDEITVLELMR